VRTAFPARGRRWVADRGALLVVGLATTLPLLCVMAILTAVPKAAAAGGWTGKTQPNDPQYAPAEQDPINHCINDEQWYLFSFIPKCTRLATDPEGAAGMSVDQAWKRFTFGRPDVKIAYVEGGINWRLAEARPELTDRVYLNTGELPLPENAPDRSPCAAYDCNGDGQVDVQDYAQDPRLHRPYVNGFLSPEDLIVAFGHCQVVSGKIGPRGCPPDAHFDNDHNGYANDISGWNFFRNNNDPATGDSTYNHSDDQMVRAAAEGNNGYGGVGVCPGCTVIPVKAGHEALHFGDRVAQSVYFAVDSGASVIILLTAELGQTDLTRAALDYAWHKGVVVVGASNDFDSSDHQMGMFWPRMWPGNGLQADQVQSPVGPDASRSTRTFRSRSNLTSFGPHALFSTPNQGGSTSESTPTQGGVAALVASEGRDAAEKGLINGRLTAGEVKQVVRATASNIDDPNLGWPGLPGATFNIQYGYGRPNLLKADEAVAANRIPPVPDIQSPDWYALFDPTHTASVPVHAAVAANRAHAFHWVLQYGLGAQPTESQFHTVASGSVHGSHVQGELGRLDLSQIPRSFWSQAFHFSTDLSSTEQYDVTLRLQATDDRGLMGEDRRSIAVFHDPTIRAGFPKFLGQGKDSEPVMADLQGSGKLDLIFGDANGRVHAVDPDTGRELPGWPAHTHALDLGLEATPAGRSGAVPVAYEPVETTPAVGDLFGNGAQEVVVSSSTGREYVFDRRGHLLPGWPRSMGSDVAGESVPPPDRPRTRTPSMGTLATPVLAHLPGSTTKLDVLQAAYDGKLYAFDGHGADVPGWPVYAQIPDAQRPHAPFKDIHDYKLVATPTLADLFGDGRLEIIEKSQESAQDTRTTGDLGFGSKFYVLAIWPDGNKHPGGPLVPGWPTPVQGTFDFYQSAQDAIAEGLESASAGPLDGNHRDQVIQPVGFFSIDAKLGANGATEGYQGPGSAIKPPAAPSDVGNDRVPTSDQDAVPVGFTQTGTLARFGGGLSYLAGGPDLATVTAIFNPGIAQRITNFMRATDTRTGAPLPGFPAPMMGLSFLTAPAVADIKGDGQPDVINNEDSNNVAAFDQSGKPVAGWPKFTGGWTFWTPAVGDLYSAGHNEVAAITREGYLFVWNTPGQAAQNQAYSFHQDNWHTGRFGVDTRPPLIPRDFAPVDSGRACWTAPGEDWAVGTAASYDLRTFSEPPTPETFLRGQPLPGAPTPALAGTRQCASIPGHPRYVALRAIDHSGLIGLPAVLSAGQSPAGVGPPRTGPAQADLGLPSAKRCRSRRSFIIHLRAPRGETLKSATVLVDGHRVRVLRGRLLHARVNLTGLPRGTFRVQISLITRSGRHLHQTRTYHTCRPRSARQTKRHHRAGR